MICVEGNKISAGVSRSSRSRIDGHNIPDGGLVFEKIDRKKKFLLPSMNA
jgi:hypothetical protein